MKLDSKEIIKGIKLHPIKTDKFKTDLTAIFLTVPIDKETVTYNCMIPAVLKRGNCKLKTQTDISKKLEDMYGTTFDCGIEKIGDNHVIKFYSESINNKFIQEFMTESLRHNLEVYFIENKLDAEKIAGQVLVNKRSRESAEKTRLNIKKQLSSNIDITNRVEKFVDCRTKDVSRREVYIVEGDSALTSVKLARNSEFQAVIPVRGKILNCLKADYDKIFKSQIITDLMRVLGCGVEIKTKHNKDLNTFDINNLRWSKVIICTDADVDGYQIRTLILSMIYALTPTLIEKGYVYIAESPLFEVRTKDETFFAYTDKEKNEIVERIGGKCTVHRSKGLGENDPDMMSISTMNPATRRLIQVTPEDAEATEQMFDILLGENLPARKDFIAENGGKYMEMLDVE